MKVATVALRHVSIIIPTLNEAENLPLLLPKIAQVLQNRAYDVLVVDDNSKDNTPAVCAELAKTYPLKLEVRTKPKNGLSGAVLHGLAMATGDIFVVMDADLQHPPEAIPKLLELLDSDQADFTIGSRYMPGGTTEEEWGLFRQLNSRIATLLARPFAGQTTDPMSWFFALRRETYEAAERLTPLGYKIGLELMCKCRVQRVREVPIHFATRAKGESKLTIQQQFKYLEHLSRLYDYTFPRAAPFLKFAIATFCGWGIALFAYTLLLRAGFGPEAAPALAYPVSILIVAIFHFRYVRTQREFLATPRPWLDFWIIAIAEWCTAVLVAMYVSARLQGVSALEMFVLTFGCATVARYILRKEFLQDVRGLRQDLRVRDLKKQ